MKRTAALLFSLMLAAACRDEAPLPPPAPAPTPAPSSTPQPTPTPVPTPSGPVEVGNGVRYEVLAAGSGDEAKIGDTPRLALRIETPSGGTLWEGPFELKLGSGQGVPGLDRALHGIRPGERRRIRIPGPFEPDASGRARLGAGQPFLIFDATREKTD